MKTWTPKDFRGRVLERSIRRRLNTSLWISGMAAALLFLMAIVVMATTSKL